MYRIQDMVVYENGGVCRVENIGTPDFLKKSNEAYYTLQPVFDKAGVIYVKVENDRHILRPLMTEDDARKMMEHLSTAEPLYSRNDKVRDQEFKDALRSCDSEKWLSMIRGIRIEKERRIVNGKKLNMSDERYLQKAMRLLTGELAVILQIDYDEAKRRIEENVTK